jgi:TPR repeat protein
MRRRLLMTATVAAALALAGRAARADDGQALYDQALALLCGSRGHPREPKAAAKLLEQAVALGHVGAQGLLGWMAMSGYGVPRDDARAARLLRPAAEAGDTAAQNNLGVLYALGSGVPHDHAQAERWFRAAAAQGAEDAARNLDELLRPLPAGSAPGRGSAGRGATRASRPPRLPPALAAAGCRAPRI